MHNFWSGQGDTNNEQKAQAAARKSRPKLGPTLRDALKRKQICGDMADRERFELSIPVKVYTRSRRAP